MSTPVNEVWGSYAAVSGLNGQSIAANANAVSAAVSLSGALGVEFSLDINFGATASAPTVYILRNGDDTNFEAIGVGAPFSFSANATPSTNHVFTVFTLTADDADQVKIGVANPSGNSSITVTLRVKTVQGAIG